MSDQPSNMKSFMEKALADVNVSLDELRGIAIMPRNPTEKRLVDDFWNELMIFVNDYDIRLRDDKYNTNRKERLRNAFSALVKHELL
jgi:hypothetical protein